MSESKELKKKLKSYSREERDKCYTAYRYLKKAERKNSRVARACEVSYKELTIEYFAEYYFKHKSEIEDQINKYEKEYVKVRKENKKIHNQKYLEKNKDNIIAYRKKYYQDHSEELKEYNREYSKNKRTERNEYAKKWNMNNPDKRKEYNKKYHLEHPEYFKEKCKEYYLRKIEDYNKSKKLKTS